jgi:hypothetical protein
MGVNTVRAYAQIQACMHAWLAVFCLSLLLWEPCDRFGQYFAVGFTALLLLASWHSYRTAQNELKPQPALPIEKQIAGCKIFFGAIVLIFACCSVAVYMDLDPNQGLSDDGDVLRFAVEMIYRVFGYWPALLFMPALGLLALCGLRYQIRQLKKSVPASPLPITRI